MLAQIPEAEKLFQETAKQFGLAVAILITLVLTLAFILWMLVRQGVRWIKPLVEQFFESHLLTMKSVQETTKSQAASVESLAKSTTAMVEQQKITATVLAESTETQGKKLDTLIAATNTTNKIVSDNGKCQVEQMRGLLKEVHDQKG